MAEATHDFRGIPRTEAYAVLEKQLERIVSLFTRHAEAGGPESVTMFRSTVYPGGSR